MRKFSKALSLNIYILTYNYIIFRERELFSIFRIFVFLGVQVNIIEAIKKNTKKEFKEGGNNWIIFFSKGVKNSA